MTFTEHPLDNKLLLGRYRIVRLLGEGGMGTVHLARVEGAEGFMRPVVVKRMKRDLRASDEGHRLFIREAKILSKLQHPGIVGISDFGIENGAHIMVLEYVHGYTLSPWLDYHFRSNQLLPVDICLFIVRRILDALHYAHHFDTEEGQEIEIVHRDVSPDNVLLSNKGYVHLLDFGIASMRGPQGAGSTKGAFRGKLCYAAPETVQGESATPRSDQYSAAIVLLELLTLETPFQANSIAEIFTLMVHDEPVPPSKVRADIPPGLDAALARALAKDPSARFESALAFSRELRRFQGDDDEEVAQRLKELVREEFERMPEVVGVASLKEREAALEKSRSVRPGPPESDFEQAQTQRDVTLLDRGGSSRWKSAPGNAVAVKPKEVANQAVTPIPASGSTSLRGVLLGLVVVGGLIALGLGAAVALLSRAGSAEQVVIVGDDLREPHPKSPDVPVVAPATALVAATSAHSGLVPEDGSSERVPGAPSSSVAEASTDLGNTGVVSGLAAPTAGLKAGSKAEKPDRQQQLSRAVQQQSGAFQACFAQHIDGESVAPPAVLHFSVARQGGPAQVEVEPPGLAATPLGSCLKSAAGRVQFPQLEEPVSFRVPVRARVSRAKGTE